MDTFDRDFTQTLMAIQEAKNKLPYAHQHLIRWVYERGGYITYSYYDDDDMIRPEFADQAIEDVEAVDGGEDFDVYLPINTTKPERICRVMLAIGYGNAPDETVADWTIPSKSAERIMDTWFRAYNTLIPGGSI